MAESNAAPEPLAFGPYRIDPIQRLLLLEREIVPLEPKVFDTLLALVQGKGRLLSKDELLERVWPGLFVEEGSLARNVSTLRKVLGEAPDGASYIETVPKRGYRLGVPVDVAAGEAPRGAVNVDPPPPARPVRLPGRRLSWALGILLAVIGTGAVAIWTRRPAAASASHAVRSLAVLPFQNLTGDPSQDYFADGTTDELTTTLAQLRAVRVISRTSTMRYKGTRSPLRDIARELGVDAIVEGSVQRIDGQTRVTTQLIDAATDTHIWATTFDADSSDLLRIQAEAAQAIARGIQAEITPTELGRLTELPTVNPAAHDEVLRGDALRWRGSETDVRQAVAHYSRAIALQPDFASAHAGLSLALELLSGSEDIEKSRAAAKRAVGLAPYLAEAHAAMAAVDYRAWDWEAGHEESRRAIDISPGSLDGCYCYTVSLAATGRSAEALSVAEQGISRSPLSAGAHFAQGLALYYARRYDEAIASFRRALDIDSRYTPTYGLLSYAYEAAGRADEAVALLEPSSLSRSPAMAVAYARAGRRTESLRLVQELTTSAVPPESQALARVYLALGDNERALAWLMKSIDTHETRAHFVIDQQFDGVRNDARFRAIVARLRLPRSYDAFFN